MSRRFGFYFILLSTLAFSACQKEPVNLKEANQTLGHAAHDLLSSSTYTSLLIEVNYMPDYAPDETSLTNLKSFLNTYINKPEGINIITQQISPSGKTSLTLSDIVSIEKRYRTAYTWGSTLAVHILITDTNFSDKDVLATSYWNTSICLFGKKMDVNSGGAGQVSRIQLVSTLLEHEFGHLLGLVDQGTPMLTDHRDSENGAHCSNSNCLMYYEVETSEIRSSRSNAIPTLDAQCEADLKANGGK